MEEMNVQVDKTPFCRAGEAPAQSILRTSVQHLQVKSGSGHVTGLGHTKRWPGGKMQEELLIWKNKQTKKRWATTWAKSQQFEEKSMFELLYMELMPWGRWRWGIVTHLEEGQKPRT